MLPTKPSKSQAAEMQKREVGYQATLQSYSEVLKPGMTRKEVEDYLRGKKIDFRRMCCIDEKTAYADLLKIGTDWKPWFCSEHNVYVAFQFAAVEPHDAWDVRDSDVLKRITIFHWYEGCL